MHSTRPHASRPPQRRRRALLVLTVLAGLLGMHALAPGGGMGHPEHTRSAHTRSAHMAVAVGGPDDCPGGDGHRGGHHPRHADPTCASGALDGGPQPPALLPDPVAVPAHLSRSRTAMAPEGARAPPSLAELQLLRI
ncbi:DUF6153 family protein [Streptomyces sp. NPDC006314]|uniref:DUF6153 family protein n=1 Tax=Streptomyces sp. NPDC006314 TaxID=3154475 RepID=UPI0033A1CD22